RRSVAMIGLWTAAGMLRLSPWRDLHEAIRESGGALERFPFNESARFPARRPPSGDSAVWVSASVEGPRIGDSKYATLFLPVREGAGELVGGLSSAGALRGFGTDALGGGEGGGDVGLAVDRTGHVISMPPGTAQMLGWPASGARLLGDSPDAEQRRLSR